MRLAYIVGFGIVGVLSRYYVGLAVGKFMTQPFPAATFLINLTGSFLIGAVYVMGIEKSVITPDLRVGLMVGLLGGYTTFSSYSLETFLLLKEKQVLHAVLYFGLSPVLGLLAAACGVMAARSVLN